MIPVKHSLKKGKGRSLHCYVCEDKVKTVKCDRCGRLGCPSDQTWGGFECDLCTNCLEELADEASIKLQVKKSEEGHGQEDRS